VEVFNSSIGEVFKFSKIAEMGTRVPRNTHAPPTLPGIISTAGHCDESRLAMLLPPFIVAFLTHLEMA
jgi:hypothetical protein